MGFVENGFYSEEDDQLYRDRMRKNEFFEEDDEGGRNTVRTASKGKFDSVQEGFDRVMEELREVKEQLREKEEELRGVRGGKKDEAEKAALLSSMGKQVVS